MASFLNRDYLSAVDTTWLRMEDPTNLMMITGVWLFADQVDHNRLMAIVEERMLKFKRFKQVVRRPPVGLPYWEDDPLFDIRNHFRHVALPAPGTEVSLQELVSDLMSEGLDFARPPWQAHIVDNVNGGSALVVRLHHCIADGIALMYVLLAMADFTAEGLRPDTEEEKQAQASMNPAEMIFRRAAGAMKAAATARTLTEQALREGITSVLHPAEAFNLLLQSSGVATTGALSLARVALRFPDPPTLFKGKLGVRKRAVWSSPIPLEDVKAIGHVTGGTVNDVLLTAMAGALRRFLIGRGEKVDGLSFRAVVPVNLRPMDTMGELGNKFGLVFLSLPIGIEDPVERLTALKKNMDALKNSPEALVTFGLLGTFGIAPAELQDLAVKIFATKATAVMTNVPGPRIPLYMAGSRIDGMMFWVPQSGKLGLGISIFSYNGTVRMGIAVDETLVGDPTGIVEALHVEIAALKALVRQVTETPAPSAPASPPPAPAAAQNHAVAQAPDDLTRVKGVGPKVALLLAEAGIDSYAALAAADEETLRTLLEAAGGRFRSMNPATWPAQAAALA